MTYRWIHNGIEYVTAADIHARWPDVYPATIRQWVHRGLLEPCRDATTGEPIRLRRANVFRWPDVVAAERATRTEARGRPRAA